MSFQEEAEPRFCGVVGSFAVLQLPIEKQLGTVRPSVEPQDTAQDPQSRHIAEDGQRAAKDVSMAW